MNHRIFTLLAFCLCLPLAGADKEKPLTSKEVLQLFVGSWDSETTTIPDGDPTKAETNKMIRIRKCSPQKIFVVEQETSDELIWVLTYNPNKKNYGSVHITPSISYDIYGNWDNSKQVMSWHGNDNNGNTMKGQHWVIDKDHHQWETDIFSGGKLLLKLKGKHTRRLDHKKSPGRIETKEGKI